ncbi:hypothetical protein ACKWTF_016573 [Chironomus riparius]
MPKVKKQSIKTKTEKDRSFKREKMHYEEFKEENRKRAKHGMEHKRYTDEDFAALQKAQCAKIMKKKRENNEDFAKSSKDKSANIMKNKRENMEGFSEWSKVQSAESMRKKRKVVEKREEEKEKDRLAKQTLKEEREKKKQEKAEKVAEQRELRMNLFYKYRETFMNDLKEIKLNKNLRHTQEEISSAKRCIDFINQIREVPSRVCCCCEGLFFKN